MKPQDVLVALGIEAEPGETYASMAKHLGMAASQVHGSIRRLMLSGLVTDSTQGPTVNRSGLKEFLIHGLAYVFPAVRGPVVRGVLTGASAPMFRNEFQEDRELPLVWPDASGDARGTSITPLHYAVSFAAKRNPRLYEVLAAVEMLRTGSSRERELGNRVFDRFLG
jgi:hypothetical protein